MKKYSVFDRPSIPEFLNYINRTKDIKIIFSFKNVHTMMDQDIMIPYIHRWHPIYRNRVLARFYKLQKWWNEQGQPPVTMMTLTTYQEGRYSKKIKGHKVSMEESFRLLQTGWRKLRMALRNRIIGERFDYVYILEAHPSSGYPHMHCAIFYEFSESQKQKIIKLWSDKYQIGSRDHGANFSVEHSERRGEAMKSRDDINYVGFYLIKYMGKSFTDPANMTKEQQIFSAYLWKKGIRQYNCSRNLSQVMKLDYEKDTNLQCTGVRMDGPGIDKELHEMPADELKELKILAAEQLVKDLKIWS